MSTPTPPRGPVGRSGFTGPGHIGPAVPAGPTGPSIPNHPTYALYPAAQRYLSQWWGPNDDQIVCPICKTTRWSLLPVVDLPIRYQPGQVLSLVPVQCDNCKYILLFNGVAAGLFDEDGMPVGFTDAVGPTGPTGPDGV